MKTFKKELNVETTILHKCRFWHGVIYLAKMNDTLKLHDVCRDPKSKCQKQVAFTPRQFQLEGSGIKKTYRSFLRRTLWEKFIKPGLQLATTLIPAAVAAETKNPQMTRTTSIILKPISRGEILSLTDMYGIGLSLRVMWDFPNNLSIRKWMNWKYVLNVEL